MLLLVCLTTSLRFLQILSTLVRYDLPHFRQDGGEHWWRGSYGGALNDVATSTSSPAVTPHHLRPDPGSLWDVSTLGDDGEEWWPRTWGSLGSTQRVEGDFLTHKASQFDSSVSPQHLHTSDCQSVGGRWEMLPLGLIHSTPVILFDS